MKQQDWIYFTTCIYMAKTADKLKCITSTAHQDPHFMPIMLCTDPIWKACNKWMNFKDTQSQLKMYKRGWFGLVPCCAHSTMSPFHTAHETFYSSSTETVCALILFNFWDTASYLSNDTDFTPTSIWYSCWGWRYYNFANISGESPGLYVALFMWSLFY